MDPNEPILEISDLSGRVWTRLKTHYEKRLELLRKQNDYDKDEKATALLRGKIDEVKRFLEIGEMHRDIGEYAD